MDTAHQSTSSSPTEEDWDYPLTDQELHAIDAAFQSAATPFITIPSFSSPVKQRQLHSDCNKRRRLPDSLFSNSFPLSPCPQNRRRSSYYQGRWMMGQSTMTFRGRIVYGRTASEVEKAAEELLRFVETKKRKEGRAVLGFDIEWRPVFTRGAAPSRAAVMQICGDFNCCYVLHIIHCGIPQNLQNLLEDPASLKVGVWIANDAAKVFQDYNVNVNTLGDLSVLANQKLGGCPKRWSLASLTEVLICKQLPKPNNIRLGNWEDDVLSKQQLQYAATDAFVSWYLYEVLRSLPVDNISEEPKEEGAKG